MLAIGHLAGFLLAITFSWRNATHMATKKKTAKKAKSSGPGRQPDPNSKSGQIRTLLESGMAVAEIAKKVGCTPGLVYNVKARLGGGKKTGKATAGKAKGGTKAAKAGPRTVAKPAAVATGSIDAIIAAVKAAEADRARLRAALEKMASVVAQALAGN